MAPSHGVENRFDHSNDQVKERKEMLYGVNQKRIYPVNKISVDTKKKLLRRSAQQQEVKNSLENKNLNEFDTAYKQSINGNTTNLEDYTTTEGE